MSKVTPYLTLYNAKVAVAFYQSVFKTEIIGEIDMLSSFEGFEDYEDKIAHCALKIEDTIVFINDNLEEEPLALGDHIQLVIKMDSEEEVREAFGKLEDGGFVFAPLQEVPWGKISGTVRDQFHVTWMIFAE